MVMHISGTFDYTFIVADGSGSGSRRMEGTLREPPQGEWKRLIGHAPLLVTEEYHKEAWQLYSRLTLTPQDREATVRSFSFSVDRELTAMLRAGDALHISRTPCAGLGLSILRGGQLVAAAGAVSAVPLGPVISVRHPAELVRQAEAIFRQRDPEYHMRDFPAEIRVGSVTRIIHAGRPTIQEYEILVRHGFLWGMPGTDESISIERRRVCPDTAAHNTAQLLTTEARELRLADGRSVRG